MNFDNTQLAGLILVSIVVLKLIELVTKYLFGKLVGDYRTRKECDDIRKDCKIDHKKDATCISSDMASLTRSVDCISRAVAVLITYNSEIPTQEKAQLQKELI